MRNLQKEKAEVIYTSAKQKVIKNVKGSSSRYYPHYNEISKKAEVFRLTEEEKNEIATKLVSELIESNVQVRVTSDEQWEKITIKFWKDLTYGDKFPNLAYDGSGEFGYNVCKFKLLEE